MKRSDAVWMSDLLSKARDRIGGPLGANIEKRDFTIAHIDEALEALTGEEPPDHIVKRAAILAVSDLNQMAETRDLRTSISTTILSIYHVTIP